MACGITGGHGGLGGSCGSSSSDDSSESVGTWSRRLGSAKSDGTLKQSDLRTQ